MKKDTPNTPDEQLDSLFRQAAAGYEPAFDPEAWKAMERKLDGPSDQPGSIWKNRLLEGLVVVGLLGGLAWLGAGSLSDAGKKQGDLAATRAAVEAGVSIPAGRKGVPESRQTGRTDTDKASRADVSGKEIAGREVSAPGKETARREAEASGKEKTIRETAVPETAGIPAKPIHAVGEHTQAKKQTIRALRQKKEPAVSNDTQLVSRSYSTKEEKPGSTSGTRRPAEKAAVPTVVPVISADTNQRIQQAVYLLKTKPWQPLPVTLRLSDPSVESAPEISKPIPPSPERWALQLMLSPDFTHVQGRAASTGLNTGLQVDYRFAPRWRASAGVIYSLKNYGASSYDYRPYDGYWQLYHRPDNIDATCKMLDIPIAVTFDAWKVRKNTFFVSVGSTSYVLLKEDYRYEYKTYDYTIEKYNGGNSWLATANLSLGLERPIGPRLTLRAEPFVKLPLGTLGFGNVKLRTEGVFFSLRYRLKSAER